MYPPTVPSVGGWPQYVVALLVWKDPDPGHLIDLTASLDLLWDPILKQFHAQQPGPGHSLGGTVAQIGETNEWTLTVELLLDGEPDEEHEFTNVIMGLELPWDSGYLALVTTPGEDIQAMQVTA